jgi:hypothetical protein
MERKLYERIRQFKGEGGETPKGDSYPENKDPIDQG